MTRTLPIVLVLLCVACGGGGDPDPPATTPDDVEATSLLGLKVVGLFRVGTGTRLDAVAGNGASSSDI